jgi:cell division protein ZapA
MTQVNISINGRIYEIGCDPGQEGRIVDLAAYIDQRLQQIARSGAAYNDMHLMVLASLVLTDELFEARESTGTAVKTASPAPAAEGSKEDTKEIAKVLETLAKRIDGIASKVAAAA